jgi:transcriptional regulator with XRE-family HTH domain
LPVFLRRRIFLFVDILKELRNKKGISQGRLAKEVGVSAGNVSDWETGKTKPGYNALAELARFFGVSADYLLGISSGNTGGVARSALQCDGVPLTESEADLIAMLRLIDDADMQTVFELVKLKYELKTGGKVSSYSMYPDVIERQKNNSESDDKSSHGIA